MTTTMKMEQEGEPHQAKDILRAVLHAILFNRLLGPTRPKDVQLDFPKLTYVKCDDAALEKEVESQVGSAMSAMIVTVTFFEKRERKGWLFGTNVEQEWERWLIKLTIREITGEAELKKFRQMMERNLQGCLLYIAGMAMEYQDHMPSSTEPIKSFHFRIHSGSGNGDSWGGILKKLINETASTNILG